MTDSVRHLFARGNTARGSHFLYDSAFQGLSKIFLLEGPPGTGKFTVLQRIADDAVSQGESVELFHSPLNPDDLDGLDGRISAAYSRAYESFLAAATPRGAVDHIPTLTAPPRVLLQSQRR